MDGGLTLAGSTREFLKQDYSRYRWSQDYSRYRWSLWLLRPNATKVHFAGTSPMVNSPILTIEVFDWGLEAETVELRSRKGL